MGTGQRAPPRLGCLREHGEHRSYGRDELALCSRQAYPNNLPQRTSSWDICLASSCMHMALIRVAARACLLHTHEAEHPE